MSTVLSLLFHHVGHVGTLPRPLLAAALNLGRWEALGKLSQCTGRCFSPLGCPALPWQRCHVTATRDHTTPCPLRYWTRQRTWWSHQARDRASPWRCTCMARDHNPKIAFQLTAFHQRARPPISLLMCCFQALFNSQNTQSIRGRGQNQTAQTEHPEICNFFHSVHLGCEFQHSTRTSRQNKQTILFFFHFSEPFPLHTAIWGSEDATTDMFSVSRRIVLCFSTLA